MSRELQTILTKEQLASKPKRQVFDLFMLHGQTKIWLDPRMPDVQLPDYLKEREVIVLEFGHEMAKPIPDLVVSSFAVEATLSFNNEPYTCIVPWDSVLAITNTDGVGVFYGQKESEESIDDTVKKEMFNKLTVLKGGKN